VFIDPTSAAQETVSDYPRPRAFLEQKEIELLYVLIKRIKFYHPFNLV
jgi:hypothetical protein